MANQSKLVANQTVEIKVTGVSETSKSFVLTLDGEAKPFFVAKRTAFSAGMVSRSSFMGKQFKITPTQETNTGQGWLGNIELAADSKWEDKLQTAAATAYTASIFANQAAQDA